MAKPGRKKGSVYYLLPADHPRLLAFLRLLESRGGVGVEMKIEDMAAELGFHRTGLLRMKDWALAYEIVEQTAQSDIYGAGRLPNRYDMLMTVADWQANGKAIVAAKRAALQERNRIIVESRKPPKKAKKAKKAKKLPTKVTEEMRRQARAEVRIALANAEPFPAEVLDPLTDDEVDLWSLLEAD